MGDTKKVLLTKTVRKGGKQYPPGSDHEWPAEIVDEIIEKDAGEQIFDVKKSEEPPVEKLEVPPGKLKDSKTPVQPETDLELPKGITLDDLVIAAGEAKKNGLVTKDGKPTVEAMEDILSTKEITADHRDAAWEILEKEQTDA